MGSARLQATVTDAARVLALLDGLVEDRISLREEFKQLAERNLTAASSLLSMADTLVANAEMGTTAVISSLYGPGASPIEEQARTDTLDKLIEVDLFQLGLMFELRSQTAEIGLLINRIEDAGNEIELGKSKLRLSAACGSSRAGSKPFATLGGASRPKATLRSCRVSRTLMQVSLCCVTGSSPPKTA